MTVAELIVALQKVEDQSIPVRYYFEVHYSLVDTVEVMYVQRDGDWWYACEPTATGATQIVGLETNE